MRGRSCLLQRSPARFDLTQPQLRLAQQALAPGALLRQARCIGHQDQPVATGGHGGPFAAHGIPQGETSQRPGFDAAIVMLLPRLQRCFEIGDCIRLPKAQLVQPERGQGECFLHRISQLACQLQGAAVVLGRHRRVHQGAMQIAQPVIAVQLARAVVGFLMCA